jgi:hypothetical protein
MQPMEAQRAKQVYSEVMGIALAIRGHTGDSSLYRELDQALNRQDWRKLAIIQHTFEMLSTRRQAEIMSSFGDPDDLKGALTHFERVLRTFSPAPVQHTA